MRIILISSTGDLAGQIRKHLTKPTVQRIGLNEAHYGQKCDRIRLRQEFIQITDTSSESHSFQDGGVFLAHFLAGQKEIVNRVFVLHSPAGETLVISHGWFVGIGLGHGLNRFAFIDEFRAGLV